MFQTRTMIFQWVIFGIKVSNMDFSGIADARQNVFMRFWRG